MSVQPTLQNSTSRNSRSPINSIHKLLYTALALVVFCGTAWSLYWKGVTWVYGPAEGTLPILSSHNPTEGDWSPGTPWAPGNVLLPAVVALGLAITALVSMARFNKPVKLRDGWLLVSAGSACATLVFILWVGHRDAVEPVRAAFRRMAEDFNAQPTEHLGLVLTPFWKTHSVSWLAVLTPCVLTMAIMGFAGCSRVRPSSP